MPEPLQFDAKRKRRESVTSGEGRVHRLTPPHLQVYDESYEFNDDTQSCSIMIGRPHVEKPYDDDLPDNLRCIGDFHGGTAQFSVIIPTDASFADIVAGYVEKFGPMLLLGGTDKGLCYDAQGYTGMRETSPRSKYVAEVEHSLDKKRPIVTDAFSLEMLLKRTHDVVYGLGYDSARDVGIEYIATDKDDEDDPEPSELCVYMRAFNKELFHYLLAEFSLVDIPAELMPHVIAHARLIEQRPVIGSHTLTDDDEEE